eukprot:3699556-Rhodomonas_salina.1
MQLGVHFVTSSTCHCFNCSAIAKSRKDGNSGSCTGVEEEGRRTEERISVGWGGRLEPSGAGSSAPRPPRQFPSVMSADL